MDEEAFAKDAEFIRAMIHYEIDMALFGLSEARKNLLARDPQALFALQLFPEAERLAELRKAKGIKATRPTSQLGPFRALATRPCTLLDWLGRQRRARRRQPLERLSRLPPASRRLFG